MCEGMVVRRGNGIAGWIPAGVVGFAATESFRRYGQL